jgi:hypothetical protein
MSMEVNVGCETASIAIVDDYSSPIVEFTDVPIIGGDGGCSDGTPREFDDEFSINPGADFDAERSI